jgi:hypothetical protein
MMPSDGLSEDSDTIRDAARFIAVGRLALTLRCT